MVMTLSLLVYSVAQRKLRNALEKANDTIPNQISKPTKTPTLRWVFQIFWGVNELRHQLEFGYECIVQGLRNIHQKILNYLGSKVVEIYL